jgi:very-short-patch-repair endonuclease
LTKRTRKPRITAKPDIEGLLLWHLKVAGFPEPERQVRFARKEVKRNWSADFAYPALRILIEVEGGVYSNGRHVRGAGYTEDCRKYNWASMLGWTLIRVTGKMVETGEALDFIEEAYRRALAKTG